MSYDQRVTADPKYMPPFKLGYRHVENSGKAIPEEARADYQKGFPDGELVIERFCPDERDEDDPLYQYTVKWAVYLKV